MYASANGKLVGVFNQDYVNALNGLAGAFMDKCAPNPLASVTHIEGQRYRFKCNATGCEVEWNIHLNDAIGIQMAATELAERARRA